MADRQSVSCVQAAMPPAHRKRPAIYIFLPVSQERAVKTGQMPSLYRPLSAPSRRNSLCLSVPLPFPQPEGRIFEMIDTRRFGCCLYLVRLFIEKKHVVKGFSFRRIVCPLTSFVYKNIEYKKDDYKKCDIKIEICRLK